MSGPIPMMLGPYAFESLGRGFSDVQRKVQTPWADIAVVQDLNQQQWTGPTSEEITIKGVLFPASYAASLDGLIASANAGLPLMFVSGSADAGLIHGTFTIQSIDEDRGFHDAAGRPWRNAYTISLKRYGRGGGLVSGLLSLF